MLRIKNDIMGKEKLGVRGGRYMAIYSRMVRLGLPEKVIFDQIFKGGKGVSRVGI